MLPNSNTVKIDWKPEDGPLMRQLSFTYQPREITIVCWREDIGSLIFTTLSFIFDLIFRMITKDDLHESVISMLMFLGIFTEADCAMLLQNDLDKIQDVKSRCHRALYGNHEPLSETDGSYTYKYLDPDGNEKTQLFEINIKRSWFGILTCSSLGPLQREQAENL